METLNKHPKTTYKIRFQDCDPFGHLNNARFLDYFLNAREDHLLQFYKLDLMKHFGKTKKSWLSILNQVSYYKPVLVSEVVVIKSRLIHYDNKSGTIEITMWDKDEKVLKALCWMRVMYVDTATGRSSEHEENIMDLFGSVYNPIEQKTFDERNAYILKVGRELAAGQVSVTT